MKRILLTITMLMLTSCGAKSKQQSEIKKDGQQTTFEEKHKTGEQSMTFIQGRDLIKKFLKKKGATSEESCISRGSIRLHFEDEIERDWPVENRVSNWQTFGIIMNCVYNRLRIGSISAVHIEIPFYPACYWFNKNGRNARFRPDEAGYRCNW